MAKCAGVLCAVVADGAPAVAGDAPAVAGGAPADATGAPVPLELYYEQPAARWVEALPVGNGRLGAMVHGGVASEKIQFNVDSLWTGDSNPSGDYKTMGEYRNFGVLTIEQDFPAGTKIENYRRSLNITNGLATTCFTVAGINYEREVFTCPKSGVLFVRIYADVPAHVKGRIFLTGANKEKTVAGAFARADAAAGDTVVRDALHFTGKFPNKLNYAAVATVYVGSANGDFSIDTGAGADTDKKTGTACLSFDQHISGDRVIVIRLAADTNYVPDAAKGFAGEHATERIARQLTASAGSYEIIKHNALADTASLMNRVSFDFGRTAPAQRALPTDRRLNTYNAGAADPELEALLVQYGRYLLQASSRAGTLPANLQGIWNDSNNPPWHSDYHTNINIQMNFWPAETTNLAECHTSLFDLIRSQVPVWRKLTAASPEYKTPAGDPPPAGWAVRTSHNIHGGLGWQWDKTANAWYCQHLFEHFAFNGDTRYLRNIAYPLIRETAEFWAALLKKRADGKLVVPKSWSPEHGPHEDGVSYSQEILWDLFDNAANAAGALGAGADREKFAALRDALLVPKIGRWGQLQEWVADRDNPRDRHRHTSHLFGVFPGHQIGYTRTPALARAAAISLEARGESGDSRREWAWAWRSALWARFFEAEKAYAKVRGLLKHNTLPNLFGNHPPFQMDGNFGIAGGVTEMLLQSHDGAAHLLPALPDAWKTGAVTGLRARGGFTLDFAWRDKKPASVKVRSALGGNLRLRLPAGTQPASCGNTLRPVTGANSNPFYRLPADARVPAQFIEYDLPTEPAGEYDLKF